MRTPKSCFTWLPIVLLMIGCSDQETLNAVAGPGDAPSLIGPPGSSQSQAATSSYTGPTESKGAIGSNTTSAVRLAAGALATGPLNVALESALGSCVSLPGDVYERVVDLLTARGHTVTVVSGTDIDTAAEIEAYDVVVFGAGAFVCDWDWPLFDAQLLPYVENGGGLVVTGWAAFYMASNPRGQIYPGLESSLPVFRGTQFATGGTITVVSGHEITDGLSDFANPQYDNFGGGVPASATILIRHNGGNPAGAAWELGDGRSVYLGPIYLANWSNYTNRPLLDGSTPDAQELFIRAIEWAADSTNDPQTKDDCKKGGWERFGFRNQGQCVRFIETGKDSREG